ncbi:hypothetical protein [Rhodococcus sp. T7]|uniref:hypothetical protein n=1 Tax=Rhodococcus sp. T7 TaxID=627444 RepID=UPI00135C8B8E|nr:hypothetical protein [Rhodococcus sp. T7]KAF0957414.1 hypothetical protein MLGJGCBP_09246 [Rhodococcus sp. T7]KAF0962115.1 hypothetical protein MLGJGCBP_04736 [Rhodococcus sp. T7]
MLTDPDTSLPELRVDQRLFICSGTSWWEALEDIRTPREQQVFQGWDVDRHYRKGDWILTYLSTRPRVFLCWEQATQDATPTGKIWVDHDTSVLFSNLIVVDHIETRTGLTISSKRWFEGTEAQTIRHELTKELGYPRSWHGLDDIAGTGDGSVLNY